MRDAIHTPAAHCAPHRLLCLCARRTCARGFCASTRVAAAATVYDWHGIRLSDGSTTTSDDTFRGSFTAGRAIEEGKMAVVVPNVATAEECLELADAACEIVQLWKLRPKSWFESSGRKIK